MLVIFSSFTHLVVGYFSSSADVMLSLACRGRNRLDRRWIDASVHEEEK